MDTTMWSIPVAGRQRKVYVVLIRRGVAGAGITAAGLIAYQALKHRQTTRERFQIQDAPAPGSPEFSRLVSAMTSAPLRYGNRIEILRNGPTLDSMIETLYQAKHTIDLSSYIYWPGEAAERFSEALIDRAKAGVEVNVVLDGYGSAKLDKSHRNRLEQGGVNVAIFRPVTWLNMKKLNNRMHRRILIVDGTVGFSGGVGIADVWTGNAQDPEHWRETHVRIEGPAVLDLVGAFLENWAEASGVLLTGEHIVENESFDDGVPLQVTKSTPIGGPTAASQLFYAAIVGARNRLWLTTAYFAPDEAFEDALCDAARRGVEIRILVNGREVDKEIALRAARRSYSRLLEAGVQIFEYDQTMLHAKVLLVDDDWANIGSGNFDSRSFDLDLELNVAILDKGAVNELSEHFLEDLEVSREIELQAWRKRPLRSRAYEHATDLVRQSL
ncbi:MAG TPA: phospholipase D-like domain-containing protein [Acidimicrobiales bacterium]|nr:phospholipase D-like domain-containing protein [Acidimicrobiales bacterium]